MAGKNRKMRWYEIENENKSLLDIVVTAFATKTFMDVLTLMNFLLNFKSIYK